MDVQVQEQLSDPIQSIATEAKGQAGEALQPEEPEKLVSNPENEDFTLEEVKRIGSFSNLLFPPAELNYDSDDVNGDEINVKDVSLSKFEEDHKSDEDDLILTNGSDDDLDIFRKDSTEKNGEGSIKQQDPNNVLKKYWNTETNEIDSKKVNHMAFPRTLPKNRDFQDHLKKIEDLQKDASELQSEITLLQVSLKANQDMESNDSKNGRGLLSKVIDEKSKKLQKIENAIYMIRKEISPFMSEIKKRSASASETSSKAQFQDLKVIAAYKRKIEDKVLRARELGQKNMEAQNILKRNRVLKKLEMQKKIDELSGAAPVVSNVFLDRLREEKVQMESSVTEELERRKKAARNLEISLIKSKEGIIKNNKRNSNLKSMVIQGFESDYEAVKDKTVYSKDDYIQLRLQKFQVEQILKKKADEMKHKKDRILDKLYREQTLPETDDLNEPQHDQIISRKAKSSAKPSSGIMKTTIKEPKMVPMLYPPGLSKNISEHDKEIVPERILRRPFTSKPEVVIFRDYEPNVKYSCKVILTNVSAKVNSFKLSAIPLEVEDLIDVVYAPPGSLSAGLTASVTIEFLNDMEEDVQTEIPFVCNIGSFKIPVQAWTRKCLPKILSYDMEDAEKNLVFNMDRCGLGEATTRSFTLKNEGKIATFYRIVPVDSTVSKENDPGFSLDQEEEEISELLGEYLPPKVEDTKSSNFFISSGNFGKLDSYSDVDIKVVFSPLLAGSMSRVFEVQFQNKQVSPIRLLIKGTADPAPVYIESSIVDVGVCSKDAPSRSSLLVKNRGSSAYRFSIELENQKLAKHIEISPAIAFVQPDSDFEVKIKMKPSDSISNYLLDGKFKINAKIVFLSLPQIDFSVVGDYTITDLAIDPLSLDFLSCNLDEPVTIPLKISNPSMITQSISFLRLPDGISVPSLEPFEIKASCHAIIPVQFKGSKPGYIRSKIAIKSNHNSAPVFIPFTAQVMELDVKFSCEVLELPSMFFWDFEGARDCFRMTNTSYETCLFMFDPPSDLLTTDGIALKFYPSKGRLRKNEKLTVFVTAQMLPFDEITSSYVDITQRKMESFKNSDETTKDSNAIDGGIKTPTSNPSSAGAKKNASPSVTSSARLSESGQGGNRRGTSANKANLGNTLSETSDAPRSTMRSASLSMEDPNGLSGASKNFQKGLSMSLKAYNGDLLEEISKTIHIPCLFQFETYDKPNVQQLGARVIQLELKKSPAMFTANCSCPDPEGNATRLNFSGSPVGSKPVETIFLHNNTDKVLNLRYLQHLSPNGPFFIINHLRSIPIGGNIPIRILFDPTEEKNYYDSFQVIANEGQKFECFLQGRGMKGKYAVEGVDPSNDATGPMLLVMSDTPLSESSSKPIRIKNVCEGRLKGSIAISNTVKRPIPAGKGDNPAWESASDIFKFKEADFSFTIQSLQSTSFELGFTPAEEKFEYECDVVVNVRGCDQTLIKCKGKTAKKDKKR